MIIFAGSAGLVASPEFRNVTAFPQADRALSSPDSLIAPLLFVLAGLSLVFAFVMRHVGLRRRERFFAQLDAA